MSFAELAHSMCGCDTTLADDLGKHRDDCPYRQGHVLHMPGKMTPEQFRALCMTDQYMMYGDGAPPTLIGQYLGFGIYKRRNYFSRRRVAR